MDKIDRIELERLAVDRGLSFSNGDGRLLYKNPATGETEPWEAKRLPARHLAHVAGVAEVVDDASLREQEMAMVAHVTGTDDAIDYAIRRAQRRAGSSQRGGALTVKDLQAGLGEILDLLSPLIVIEEHRERAEIFARAVLERALLPGEMGQIVDDIGVFTNRLPCWLVFRVQVSDYAGGGFLAARFGGSSSIETKKSWGGIADWPADIEEPVVIVERADDR